MEGKLLYFSLFLMTIPLTLPAQEISFALAGNQVESYQSSYELVEVMDLRNSKPNLGRIFTGASQTANSRLEGGMQQGLKVFYEKSFRLSSSHWPIQMRVHELIITEKKQEGTVVTGDVKMKFGFYVKGSFDPVHLVDYESGMNYRRSVHRTDLVDQVLVQGIRKSFQYLNNWILEHSASDRRLAKAVQVEIVQKKRISDQDTVFYNFKRPIVWSDFKDRPGSNSRFNASIFTSLALEGTPHILNGTIILPLEVKAYMLPGSSWVKSSGQNEYGLNHEQRHFDLTHIVSNRLKVQLQSLELDPENYDAKVNDAFFEAFREMNRLQEIYDNQTQHGINGAAQMRWDNILDEALQGNMANLEIELQKGQRPL